MKAINQPDPKELDSLVEGVKRLARNIWWTWNPRAQNFFEMLAPQTWERSFHNAVAVVNALSPAELRSSLCYPNVGELARVVIKEFQEYLDDKRTWAHFHAPGTFGSPVAYFSAEFGLHESLPIYSGGLGVLSGDHTKSASDIGLPLVGVGLFYRNGYFNQQIDVNGWQLEFYPALNPESLPLERAVGSDGKPLACRLDIVNGEITVGAWRVNVGRNHLYLLDTNFPENDPQWRDITSRVYGGDSTMRIAQEMVLGIGGARILSLLGVKPSVYHMNEGHSAFLILELLRSALEDGLDIGQAVEKVRELAVFTTHTPVPAGHDRFHKDLIHYVMPNWPAKLKMTLEEFMALGRVDPEDAEETFCMTVLALKHSRAANAVSELNARVSRKMWEPLYERKDTPVPPIGHVTNGVHILGWMNQITYDFWETALGPDWLRHLKHVDFWEKIADEEFLPDSAIWSLRYRLKRQMIEAVRQRVANWYHRYRPELGTAAENLFSADALTIGFSRRFATYKRAPLIFHDLDRAARLFNDRERPLQIVFAGKAHPRDDAAKAYMQQIFQISRDDRFRGKVIVVEGYDIQLARFIISGSDVLLNNPRRPLEASGTSGQKITVHGGINLGIMDGWWREGYDGHNGFAIGPDESLDDPETQDEVDARYLYEALEKQVVPEFYDRGANGLPHRWIGRIRRAMATLIPRYTTDRMVCEYTEKYYKRR